MKLILLYVLIVCGIMNLNGDETLNSDQPNHLTLVYPYIDENGVVHDVEDIVTAGCDIGLMIHRSPNSLSCIAIFSYKPDGFVYVMRYSKKDFSKNVITNYDLEISEKLALAIYTAWKQMLIETTYPKKAYKGIGGETYYFEMAVIGIGVLRGEIWEPKRGLPLKMTELGKKLQKVAEKEKALTPKEEELLIKELNAFEKLAKETYNK